MLLWIGLGLLAAAVVPYVIFVIGIHIGKKPEEPPALSEYPPISIVISAYNEEAVIRKRVENILVSSYPADRYEVIFVDDCSSDNTRALALDAFEKAGIDHRIIANTERLGTNRSYNKAILAARFPIVVTTDADVFFECEALERLIARLVSDERIAAVCGDLYPLPGDGSHPAQMEGAYRNYYGRMCSWESAVDSTYAFNGALVAFKRDLVTRIDDRRGADDANTAFEAIRRGYLAVYEPGARVYEDVPPDFHRQYRQKIRRATHLIEATISNLDLLRHPRPFSRFFYPLRIYMYLATPALFFTGSVLFVVGLALAFPVLAIGVLGLFALIGYFRRGSTIVSFATNQVYLAKGLLNLGKDMRVWESTSNKVGTG
ncbi:MAG: glycosyltransferase [Methanomicrobiales archaeon]|nr:glycosyltransferase [Methanomicrobiales archaeon]